MRRSRGFLNFCASVTGAGALIAQPLAAQRDPGWTAAVTQTGDPSTIAEWTPLAPIANHHRSLPAAPLPPQLILLARPLTGAFWTAGNPAALPAEVHETHGELRAGVGGVEGAYRRPLDAPRTRAVQLSALGWRRVGERSAAAGRLILDQEDTPLSAQTLRVEPYVSNPFVLTDTISPQMVRTRARLEGAMGWRYHGWKVGGGAGIESREQRSQNSAVRRTGRATLPGIIVGVARELPIAQMSIGARARWTGGNETGTTAPPPNATTRLFVLRGYDEPEPLNAPGVPTTRRIEADATTLGLDLAGVALGAQYVFFAERTERKERQVSALQLNAPTDRWTADGHALGGALQRQLPSNLLITITARLSALDGDATRADLDGTVFRAHESRFSALLDARWLPAEGGWRAGLLARTARDYSERTDFLAQLRSEIEAWSPGASLELARRVTSASWVALAFGQTWYSAASTIPAPNDLSDEYQRLIAPELALNASAARATAFTLTASTEFGGSALWGRLSREELSPTDREPVPTFAPEGDRSRWTLAIGLHL